MLAALVIVAIWFPIRLIHELLKAIDLSEKPDHSQEARELFRQAYSRSCDLPSKSDFARSVLDHAALPRALHDALFEAFRALYAENMMLTVPPIPADLEHLDGIRWRDRMRREIARMNAETTGKMRRACVAAVNATVAAVPEDCGRRRFTSPLATLVNPGRFVENLVRPLDAQLFPAFAEKFLDNTYSISGVPRAKYAKPPKLDEPHHLDDPCRFSTERHSTASSPPAPRRHSPGIPHLAPLDRGRNRRGQDYRLAVFHRQGSGARRARRMLARHPRQPAPIGRGPLGIEALRSRRAPRRQALHLNAADIEYPIALNLFDMRLDRLATSRHSTASG